MMTSEHTAKEIEKTVRRFIGLLKREVKFIPMQSDIAAILKMLKADERNQTS